MTAPVTAAPAAPAPAPPDRAAGPPSRGGPPGAQQERGRWWTLVAVSVAIFMLLVDVTIVNVALPSIEADLGSSFADLQWVVDAYVLTLAAFLLTAGSLGDRLGRRALFVVGIALFSAASLGAGLAPSPTLLTTARAVQGVGGAIVFATSLALLAATYRGRDRGTAFGVYGAVTGASSALGPLIGGVLVTGLSWRWIFFVNVPVGLLAIVVSLARLKESRDPTPRRVDVPGVLTFSSGLALVVYGLVRGTGQGWTSTATLAQLGGGVVLLALFLLVEARSDHPMLDLSLFRVPAFVGAQVAAFTISAALFALFPYLGLYLQNVLGFSALGAGVRLLSVSVLAVALAPLAGRLTATVPYRFLISAGFVFLTVGLLLMSRVDATSSWWVLFPGLLLAGAGIGAVNAPLGGLAVDVVEPRRAGMASGINSTSRQVGIAVGIAVYGALLSSRVSSGIAPSLDGAVPAAARAGIDDAVAAGVADRVAAGLPGGVRAEFVAAATEAFTSSLSLLFLVAAVLAAVGAVACLVLIRQRDVRSQGGPPAGPPGGPPAGLPAAPPAVAALTPVTAAAPAAVPEAAPAQEAAPAREAAPALQPVPRAQLLSVPVDGEPTSVAPAVRTATASGAGRARTGRARVLAPVALGVSAVVVALVLARSRAGAR